MSLVAKEDLWSDWNLIAKAGTVVSPAMVEANGWQDKVYDNGVTPSSAAPPRTDPPSPHRRTSGRRPKA